MGSRRSPEFTFCTIRSRDRAGSHFSAFGYAVVYIRILGTSSSVHAFSSLSFSLCDFIFHVLWFLSTRFGIHEDPAKRQGLAPCDWNMQDALCRLSRFDSYPPNLPTPKKKQQKQNKNENWVAGSAPVGLVTLLNQTRSVPVSRRFAQRSVRERCYGVCGYVHGGTRRAAGRMYHKAQLHHNYYCSHTSSGAKPTMR